MYDSQSEFFSDICYTYTNNNGTDVILKDRQTEFINNNRSICEENCNLVGYNNLTQTVECSCQIKLSLPIISEIHVDHNNLYKFMDIKTIANFNVMKCANLFFSKVIFKNNIGYYFALATIIIYFICLAIFLWKGFRFLKAQINAIVWAKRNLNYLKPLKPNKSIFQTYLQQKHTNLKRFQNSIKTKKMSSIFGKQKYNKLEKEKKNNNNIRFTHPIYKNIFSNGEGDVNKEVNSKKEKENDTNKMSLKTTVSNKKDKNKLNKPVSNLKRRIQKKSNFSLSTENLLTKRGKYSKQKENRENRFLREKQKIKSILDYTSAELNDLGYKKAIRLDHRTYFEFYFSLIKSGHLLIKIFESNDYNSRIIKIFLCIYNFVSCYAVNALFFDDETMHKIYEDGGNFNFWYQLPKIIYSSAISYIIDSVIVFLSSSQSEILELKRIKKLKYLGKKARMILKKIRLKLTLFFIISFLFLLLFWYYLGCFCAVYVNTQYHLIKDTLISFLTENCVPIIAGLLPGLFRIYSLSKYTKGKKLIYLFSQFITKILF